MKLNRQKDVFVSVEIDGSLYIPSDEGLLYENTDDKAVYLFIQSQDGSKKIKIQIHKK